jgi:hypothetical protein
MWAKSRKTEEQAESKDDFTFIFTGNAFVAKFQTCIDLGARDDS